MPTRDPRVDAPESPRENTSKKTGEYTRKTHILLEL